MAELTERLIKMGRELGYSGADLQMFLKDENGKRKGRERKRKREGTKRKRKGRERTRTRRKKTPFSESIGDTMDAFIFQFEMLVKSYDWSDDTTFLALSNLLTGE